MSKNNKKNKPGLGSSPWSIFMILGGLLTIIPNIPIVNEFLPLAKWNTFLSEGVIHFLGISGDALGFNFSSSGESVKWTMLELSGEVMWGIFVISGVLALFFGFNAVKRILPLENIGLPFSVSVIVSLVTGLVTTALSALIILTESSSSSFGLANLSGGMEIGLGFWLLLGGSVLLLLGGIIGLVKDD